MNKKVSKVLSSLTILLNGLFSSIGLSEFYNVGIKKETENYPFGGEGPTPFFYETAELYANVNLAHGLVFGILLGLGIWNLTKGKPNVLWIIGLTLIALLIQAYVSRT